MNPRSSYFHQTRYANPSLHYPSNPNFHRHSNFLSTPPPSQQLRPQQTTPPPASFPQFNPSDPQFTCKPDSVDPHSPHIHDNYHHQRLHHDLPHFTQFPSFSHQFDDGRQLPRRLPEFDQRVHDPPPDFRVLRDDWQTRHGLEGNPNSRFIQERNIVIDREGENYHRRGEFGSHSDTSSSGFRAASNQLRGFESNSGNCENRRVLNFDYQDKVGENQRWAHDREVLREPRDSLIEYGSHEMSDGDNRVTGKREHYRSREGNLEFERHGGKRSREGSYEFNRTPRKQVQKKSALLRIQKPSYRTREDERMDYLGYIDDTKSSCFRGKDQESGFFRGKDKDDNLYTDCGMGDDGGREGSPVELDVSFKSNSLVAKAIVTPSSNSAGASETNLDSRNSKIRKVFVPDKDNDKNSLNSSLNKPTKVAVELDYAGGIPNKGSGSDKGLKNSKEGVTANEQDSSLPGNNSFKMKMPIRSGTDVISGKTSSLKVGKKKKVVKKVVRKVVNPNSASSGSQRTKKRDEPVKVDGFAHNPPAPIGPDKAFAVNDIVDSQRCPNEAILIPESDKVEGLPKCKKPAHAGTSSSSGNLFESSISGKKSCLLSPLGSLNQEETEFDESFINGDCAKNLPAISNTGNSLVKSPDETIPCDIGGVDDSSNHPCQTGDSCLVENNAVTGSLKDLDSLEGHTDFSSLSSEKMIIQESTTNSLMSNMGLDNAFVNLQERTEVSNNGISDIRCKVPCTIQGSLLVENGFSDQLLNGSFPVTGSEIFSVSFSGATVIQDDVICHNQGAGTMLGSANGCSNSEKIHFSHHGPGDDIAEQLSQDGDAYKSENVSIIDSLKTMVSTGGIEEDVSDMEKNSKEIEMSQLDLSRLDVSDMHMENENVVTSTTAHWVDTTLRLCFEDNVTSECTFSCPQFVGVGSRCCSDGASVLHHGSLTDVSKVNESVSSADADPSEVSPRNENSGKSSALPSEIHCPVESDSDKGPVFAAGNSTTSVEVSSTSDVFFILPEKEVAVSDMDPLCTSDLLPAQKGITALHKNYAAGEYFSTVVSVKDAFEDDGREDVQAHLAVEKLEVPSHSPLVLGDKDIINATPVMVASSNQNGSMDIEAGEREKMDVDAAVIDSRTAQCQTSIELKNLELDEKLQGTDMEDGSFHGSKNDLPCVSNSLSPFGDGIVVSTANSGDELGESVPGTDTSSPETLLDVLGTSLSQNSVEKVHGTDDKIQVEKAAAKAGYNSSPCFSGAQNANSFFKLDHAVEGDSLLSGKTGPLPSQDSKITDPMVAGRKIQTRDAHSKIPLGRSSFGIAASRSTASSTRTGKTWHRTDNSSDSAPPANKGFSSTHLTQRQFPKEVYKSQSTSYVRKGNSLVRKPISVAPSQGSLGLSSSVYQLNSSGTDEPKKSAGSGSRIETVDPLNVVRTGSLNTAFERTRTPPLSSVPKIPNQAKNLGGCVSSPMAEHAISHSTETASASAKFMESNDIPKSSDDSLKISESPMTQNSQINNLECQIDPKDENNVVSENVKRLTYVKRKVNQLVATSNPYSSSVESAHNGSSDSYYKRRKNQLIRTSLERQVKQTASMPVESLSSEGHTALNSLSSRNFSKRLLRKVVTKAFKPSKFSFVWTLYGAQIAKDDSVSLHHGKVLPHLVPWKRATYRRSYLPKSSSNSNHGSLSTIGKLVCLRKMNTVYTRSKHGFSLRKSKVLSVGGASLKWSKSIGRHSKKANEEATLAVAAAERKKREQKSAADVASRTKCRNQSSRERIFRIGSVRYKMDSSRRTLQRISDEESSCSGALQNEKEAKDSYIPRRLMIGKDEYVRVGNGNQLIRDPKKRTRILASEKVRWSLHTARSRLARKRKYCQFFTRFGKCNKDDGKCPFIHDSSKIAVCTKFLNGLCSNPDCKLTHEVIPERMPDCSYFLQGLCSNENCPYRHVHVNPNASTCEGFLRGYCADGNECLKKHSYVCPVYEATGSCPQGTKCKLHHPRNRIKEKKSKQKNAQGRYFGLVHIKVTKPRNMVPEKLFVLDHDGACMEGGSADYISLDVGDEKVVDNDNPADEHTAFGDIDHLDWQLGDIDELIKPVRIMDV